MAQYTVTILDLLRNKFDFGLKNYPIFNESYRDKLNEKILYHFITREIGFEVEHLFYMKLNIKMSEIMPYYNQMYESELIKINPLITQTMESVNNQKGKSDSETIDKNVSDFLGKTITNTLPQSPTEDFFSAKYANESNLSNNIDKNDGISTGKSNQETDSIVKVNGFTGSQSQALNEFRTTFLNIDMMVIDELEPLFMSLW